MQVSGRCYPVQIMHAHSLKERRVESSITAAIRIHLHEGEGHILVFLTGFEECERACKLCFKKLCELAEEGREVPSM